MRQYSDLYIIPTGTSLAGTNSLFDDVLLFKDIKADALKALFLRHGLTHEQVLNLPNGITEQKKKELDGAIQSLPNLPVRVTCQEGSFGQNFLDAGAVRFSHSPAKRAEMLYEALTQTDNTGDYKYHNIFLRGGSNTEDVIIELEKLIAQRGELPKRTRDLQVFGFSDATQLLHYLGQRGVASVRYYSKNHNRLVEDIRSGKTQEKTPQTFKLSALNEAAAELSVSAQGYLLPANQVQVEDRSTHQTKFFKEGCNFIVAEYRSQENVDAFLELYQQKYSGKNIALALSKDMQPPVVAYLCQQIEAKGFSIPVLSGMPVGHGSCQTAGEAIALFSSATLQMIDGKPTLQVQPFAEQNVVEQLETGRRAVAEWESGQDREAVVKRIDGSDGVVFANKNSLEKHPKQLIIHLQKEYDGQGQLINPWQQMDMAVKKLLEKKVIDPQKLETLKFVGLPIKGEHKKAIETGLSDLHARYLSNTQLEYCKDGVILPRLSGKLISGMSALGAVFAGYNYLQNQTQNDVPTHVLAQTRFVEGGSVNRTETQSTQTVISGGKTPQSLVQTQEEGVATVAAKKEATGTGHTDENSVTQTASQTPSQEAAQKPSKTLPKLALNAFWNKGANK